MIHSPLGLETFSQEVEQIEKTLSAAPSPSEEYQQFLKVVKLMNHALKLEKNSLTKGLIGSLSSCLRHSHTTSKVILTVLLFSIGIYVLVQATPVAGWIVGFFEDVYNFVVDAIEWIVALIEEIYQWIVDAIDTLPVGVGTTVNFVKSFSKIMKKFFEDLSHKFQNVFRFVEDFSRIMGDFFSDLIDEIINAISIFDWNKFLLLLLSGYHFLQLSI
jgi:phage-related protein